MGEWNIEENTEEPAAHTRGQAWPSPANIEFWPLITTTNVESETISNNAIRGYTPDNLFYIDTADNDSVTFVNDYSTGRRVILDPNWTYISFSNDQSYPISIGVDRNIHEIILLENRIEIRRILDNESNNNGTHDESLGSDILSGENMLQQWDSEQNS